MRPLCSISSKLRRRSSEGEWANAQEAPYRQRGQLRHISVLRWLSMMEEEEGEGEGEEEEVEEPGRRSPLLPLPLLLLPLLLKPMLPPDDGESIGEASGEGMGVRGGLCWWSRQEEDEADKDDEARW